MILKTLLMILKQILLTLNSGQKMTKNILIILICALLFTCADVIHDSLVFYKSHLGEAGYRDFWHLLKYIMRISLFFFSVFTYIEYKRNESKWETVLTIGVIILICLGLWQVLFAVDPSLWYSWDTKVHISTGVCWIDRLLGFHL